MSHPIAFAQGTLDDVALEEYRLVQRAAERYGDFFHYANDANRLLVEFIGSINETRPVFEGYLALLRKHHTLALLSCLRRHHAQAMMNLRQVIEGCASAAYTLANRLDDQRILTEPELRKLVQHVEAQRYKWLASRLPLASKAFKSFKDSINQEGAHASAFSARNRGVTNNWAGDFFDVEDDYLTRIDIQLVGNVAFRFVHFMRLINQEVQILTMAPGVDERLEKLELALSGLRTQIESHERYKQAKARERRTRLDS